MRPQVELTAWVNRWFAAVVGLLLSACAPAADSGVVAGGEVWELEPEPLVQIGGNTNDPYNTIWRVVGATRLADGRIVIANGGSSQLRVYSPAGQHLEDIGGDGDGPGEFRYLFQMVKGTADSLIVMGRRGVTWFDSSGQYVRSVSTNIMAGSSAAHPCRFGEGDMWTLLSDGRLALLLVDNTAPVECGPTPSGTWRMTGLLGFPTDVGFDTVALMPATERVNDNYRVFGHDLLVAFASDRIYAGDTAADSILALSHEGDTVAFLPTPFESKAVPIEAKDEGPIEVRQSDGSTRFVPGYRNFPDEFPRYGRLLTDSQDLLWVMEYPTATEPFNSWRLTRPYATVVPDDGAFWRVMDRTGSVVAELRTPPDLFVMEIGDDYVLGLSRDEYDVEMISLFGLRRSGS